MGSGIAHVCAASGFQVMLNDVSEDRIKSGLATVNGNLARQVAKQVVSETSASRPWHGSRSLPSSTTCPTATW